MGWNFRKSIKIAPGVKLNFSKRGVGMSVGPKGYKISVNSKGDVHKTISIPGTGLYKREKIDIQQTKQESASSQITHKKMRWLKILRIPLWLLALFFTFVSFSLFSDGNITSGIISLIFPLGFFIAGLLCK